MPLRNIVTARSLTDNTQIFVKCDTVLEALQVQQKLLQIELKEHTYTQIRLRSSKPSKRQYKEILKDFII